MNNLVSFDLIERDTGKLLGVCKSVALPRKAEYVETDKQWYCVDRVIHHATRPDHCTLVVYKTNPAI